MKGFATVAGNGSKLRRMGSSSGKNELLSDVGPSQNHRQVLGLFNRAGANLSSSTRGKVVRLELNFLTTFLIDKSYTAWRGNECIGKALHFPPLNRLGR